MKADNDLNKLVQRRAFERRPAKVNISFFYSGIFYSGHITNVSQGGMFIRTMVTLPPGILFPIIIRGEAEVSTVLARVRHRRKSDCCDNGIGVEIVSRPATVYRKWIDQT